MNTDNWKNRLVLGNAGKPERVQKLVQRMKRGVRPMEFAEGEFYCKILFRAGDQRIRPILTAMFPLERPEKQVVGWAVERADGGC